MTDAAQTTLEPNTIAERGFGHVETWVFDLDNTLYPAECDLFSQIDHRMGSFIAETLGLTLDDAHALRKKYYFEHGTTLAGLIRLHGVKPHDFLDYVHDIDLGVVDPSPELVGIDGCGRRQRRLERPGKRAARDADSFASRRDGDPRA